MLCYHCTKASDCPTFRTLYSMSKDFCINDCRDFNDASNYKYRKIAENDLLMKLIYDYFTENIEGYSEEEAKKAITGALWNV